MSHELVYSVSMKPFPNIKDNKLELLSWKIANILPLATSRLDTKLMIEPLWHDIPMFV